MNFPSRGSGAMTFFVVSLEKDPAQQAPKRYTSMEKEQNRWEEEEQGDAKQKRDIIAAEDATAQNTSSLKRKKKRYRRIEVQCIKARTIAAEPRQGP